MALDGDEVDDDNDRIALHSAVPLGQYGLSTFFFDGLFSARGGMDGRFVQVAQLAPKRPPVLH